MQNFFQEIENYEYISFDIFDTAVLRKIKEPKDIFSFIARYTEKYSPDIYFDNFYIQRISAEEDARTHIWETRGEAEVTLDDIYEVLEDHLQINGEQINKLKNIEMKIEKEFIIFNPFIYELYTAALNLNKKILFISDIYLPESFIKEILKDNGYLQYKKLYVSSTIKKTKSEGTLFSYVLDDLEIDAKDVIHIGDNYNSDVVSAKKNGLFAMHYTKALDIYQKNNINLGIGINDKDNLETKLFEGAIINKFFNEMKFSTKSLWYQIGFLAAGPIHTSFTFWLYKEVTSKNIESVYFLARDGYIYHRLFKHLLEINGKKIHNEYMYASRRLLNIPSIDSLDEEVMEFLIGGTSKLQVKDFLERIGLSSEKYKNHILAAGFSSTKQFVQSNDDYKNLKKLFTHLEKEILNLAKMEKKTLIEYFSQIGLLDSKKISFVDIGWHGSLQKSLLKILEPYDITIDGYYLGIFERAKDIHENLNSIHGHLFNLSKPNWAENIIKQCVEVFELIHSAPHGSLIRLKKENDSIYPVMAEEEQDLEKKQIIEDILQGSEDFFKEVAPIMIKYDLTFKPEFSLSPIARLLNEPTKNEANLIGDIYHMEGFGNISSKRYIAKPKTFYLNFKRYIDDFNHSFWKKGFKKRSPLLYLLLIASRHSKFSIVAKNLKKLLYLKSDPRHDDSLYSDLEFQKHQINKYWSESQQLKIDKKFYFDRSNQYWEEIQKLKSDLQWQKEQTDKYFKECEKFKNK